MEGPYDIWLKHKPNIMASKEKFDTVEDKINKQAFELAYRILDEFNTYDVNKFVCIEDLLRKYAKDVIDEFKREENDTSNNKS